jgi:hypothetical protein
MSTASTHLAHEVGDDAVELRVLEVQRFALLAHALLAGAQRTEVLSCLRHNVGEQLQLETFLVDSLCAVKTMDRPSHLHDYTTSRLVADGHVEVYARTTHSRVVALMNNWLIDQLQMQFDAQY